MTDEIVPRHGRSPSIPRPTHGNVRAEALPGERPKAAEDDWRAPEALRRIMLSPSYREADRDLDFLQGEATRGIRLQLDFLKTESVLAERGVAHTIVVFGSTRICEPKAARRALDSTALPIIFITAHGDIPMTVQAMKRGAVEFLTKPFRDQDLLDAIEIGLARDRARRETDKVLNVLRERYATLSSREREIMVQATAGRLNKQIASEIGIAESTVKVHRTNLMRKMKARSLPELSRMADLLNRTAQ